MNRKVLAISTFGCTISLGIVCLAVFLLVFGEACVQTKRSLAETIIGSTLSLGAFSLALLGYSLAQKRDHAGTVIARIHTRVAMIMYMLLPLSLFDALTSISYLITDLPWMFDVTLSLLFIIGLGFVAVTTYVVAEEFR